MDRLHHFNEISNNNCKIFTDAIIFCRKASGFLGKCKINGKEETMILTNHHVLNSVEMAKKFIAAFNYDGMEETKTISCHPEIFFRTCQVKSSEYIYTEHVRV